MGHEFTVNYIENSCLDAINPCFPAIHISTTAAHSAWVHLIYTDSVCPHQRLFIDAGLDDFPFYTHDLDFYDAPYWNYTLLKKTLSFWRGRAYAVQLDDNQKIIGCVGGISWGFKLSFFRTNPKMIAPNVLSTDNWQQDLKLIEMLIKVKEDA